MKKEQSPKCRCPYCEEELDRRCMEPPFCVPCGVDVVRCSCGSRYNAGHDRCPHCGKPREAKKQP